MILSLSHFSFSLWMDRTFIIHAVLCGQTSVNSSTSMSNTTMTRVEITPDQTFLPEMESQPTRIILYQVNNSMSPFISSPSCFITFCCHTFGSTHELKSRFSLECCSGILKKMLLSILSNQNAGYMFLQRIIWDYGWGCGSVKMSGSASLPEVLSII